MLGSALYYPHIDIDDPKWLRSAVLFWDEIKTIAPRAIRSPFQSEDTKTLWKEGYLERFRVFLNRFGFPNHFCSDSLMLAGWRPASDDRTDIKRSS